MKEKQSLSSDYFRDVYEANEDPWNFETSEYEKGKYSATIAALPRPNYQNALEIGCSIGVLTQILATHCTNLLATDVSQKALDIAAKRCTASKNVSFRLMDFHKEIIGDQYDLIMISEVAYYLSSSDWKSAINNLYSRLAPEGNIVLVHWLPKVHDYPQTGDEVHENFEIVMKGKMENVFRKREENYRMDIWVKS